MEEAAERDRVQLSALLTMGATGQLVAFERGKHSSMLARLKLELAAEEVRRRRAKEGGSSLGRFVACQTHECVTTCTRVYIAML